MNSPLINVYSAQLTGTTSAVKMEAKVICPRGPKKSQMMRTITGGHWPPTWEATYHPKNKTAMLMTKDTAHAAHVTAISTVKEKMRTIPIQNPNQIPLNGIKTSLMTTSERGTEARLMKDSNNSI